jgi:hypothetical protein
MEYVVTNVIGPSDPWSNDHGTYTPYAFKVQGVDKVVRWNRKHKDGQVPAGPSEGERLEGELEDKGNYLKFKKSQGSFTGGKANTGGQQKSYDRQPDHPVQMQRALHTSAMSLTPSLIEQMLTLGVVERPSDKAGYLNLVSGVASWVLASYPAAVLAQAEKAEQS